MKMYLSTYHGSSFYMLAIAAIVIWHGRRVTGLMPQYSCGWGYREKDFQSPFYKSLFIKGLHFCTERPSVPKMAQFGPSGSVLGQSYRESD